MTTNTKPIQTLRDGSLKAAIWKNTGESGDFYSVQFTRTWKDEQGGCRVNDSFSGSELLRIARLANVAYDEITRQRAGQPDEA